MFRAGAAAGHSGGIAQAGNQVGVCDLLTLAIGSTAIDFEFHFNCRCVGVDAVIGQDFYPMFTPFMLESELRLLAGLYHYLRGFDRLPLQLPFHIQLVAGRGG